MHSNQVEYNDGKSVETAVNELYEKYYQSPKYMKDIGCEGCTKLEYLESTGSQYIDTGINNIDLNNTIIEYKSLMPAYPGYVVGYQLGSSYYGVRANNSSSLRFHFNGRYQDVNFNIYDANYHTFRYWNSDFYIDDVLYSSLPSDSFQVSSNIYIFARNQNNSRDCFASTKLSMISITYNGIMLRNFIPVLDANGRPCLFDKVSKTCFYNQGNGDDFLYGY